MLQNLKYYKESRDMQEAVEGEIYKHGQYYTTCVIGAYSLTSGIKAFPCGIGDDYELKGEELVLVLEFIQKQREAIASRYPVKTYEGWQESGLPTFEDYCKPGDTVDEAMVDYFMNCVPPVSMSSSCAQVGEAYNHVPDDKNRYRATYLTFVRLSSSQWRFAGYCYAGETTNRVEVETSLERRIKEARTNG